MNTAFIKNELLDDKHLKLIQAFIIDKEAVLPGRDAGVPLMGRVSFV